MRKSGESLLMAILFWSFVIVAAIIFINPVKDFLVTARGYVGCDNASLNLSTGQQLTCLAVSGFFPYFIMSVIVAAGSYLFYKKVFEGV